MEKGEKIWDRPATENDSILEEVIRIVDTLIRRGSNNDFSIFEWIPGLGGIPSDTKADILAFQ